VLNILKMGQPTEAEINYLKRIHPKYLWLLIAHIPVAMWIAWHFNTSYWEGIFLIGLTLSLPIYAVWRHSESRLTSCILAAASICLSGVLIHLSRGMIELHFHIFVSLAWMIVFANPWALLTACLTAAAHHLVLYVYLPASVFNYEASLGIVLLHAAFVIAETIGNVFISARLFALIKSQDGFQKHTHNMKLSVGDLANGFESTANEFKDQAANLQSASSSLVELTRSAEETASHAQKASDATREINKAVQRGKEAMANLRQSVDQLQASAAQTGSEISGSFNEIESLINFFSEIETKTKLINDIVFQTRLLSFNASVEAARAREHGKGFAVVAEEVGNLAQMSGKAAEEINSLLSSGVKRSKDVLANATDQAKLSMNRISSDVTSSRDQMMVSMHSFESITELVDSTISRLGEIATASQEQQSSVEHATKMFSDVISVANDVAHRSIQKCGSSRSAVDECFEQINRHLSALSKGEALEVSEEPSEERDVVVHSIDEANHRGDQRKAA
jgi:methyl-accepting chemotaxis protein